MNAQTTLWPDILACPRTGERVIETQEGLANLGGQVHFPRLDGVPALFAEPEATLGEWRDRLHLLLVQLEQHAQRLHEALGQTGLLTPTRERLTRLHAATLAHRELLADLLAPLGLSTRRASVQTHLALRTRLPSDQGLTSYYANVHRDWAWGDAENEGSLALLQKALGPAKLGRTLVLGAGAGRLAWDVHQQLSPTFTVALDFNPLLVLLLARLVRGDTVALYEFPIAPRSISDHAILRELHTPVPTRPGFHPLLGDALRPPFSPGSFDTVITPWVIDILPEAAHLQLARINNLLAADGQWLHFGSLNFNLADPAMNYSLEETLDLAASTGFSRPEISETVLPYMCSPASRHGRSERVIAMRALKVAETTVPPRHTALPDWLVSGRTPVPVLPAFRDQAMATRIHLFIIELIDGKRSLRDMAAMMEQQRLMTRDEAEESIRGFLIRLFEDAQRGQRY